MFEYSVGFSSTTTTEKQKTSTYDLSYEMQTGITFEIFSASEKLSASFHQEVMTDTTTAMTRNISIKTSVTCD